MNRPATVMPQKRDKGRTMSFKMPHSTGISVMEIGGYELNDETVFLKKPRPLIDVS